jgi:hypothetical protein
MGDTSNQERRAAAALVAALEDMLVQLQDATPDGDLGWLRPLAVLTAEIEYSALRRTTVDVANLAEECREVSDLLACSPRVDVQFASRYPLARRASPTVADLHKQALAACHLVVESGRVTQGKSRRSLDVRSRVSMSTPSASPVVWPAASRPTRGLGRPESQDSPPACHWSATCRTRRRA